MLTSENSTSKEKRKLDQLALFLVIAVSVTIAIVSYLQYLEIVRFRWGGMENDRNAHYLFGLSLALDVQQFDIRNLFSDLDGARVWPPLHGILTAFLLLVGGLDHRLAVLPSLAGWLGTVVFGFLVARRSVSSGGNIAGWVAVIFILASPAHRVFATDVMLESLGSGLSLLVFYLYLVAVQEPSKRAYRNLALALTALFLIKYNYWLLVVAGLLAAQIADKPKAWWSFFLERINAPNWKAWARAEIHHPLNYVMVTSLILMSVVLLSGGWRFEIWGQEISMRSHHNFVQVAYLALLIRCGFWWKRTGRAWFQGLNPLLYQLAIWHAWPVALWLSLPKRVGYFLFFLSPANGANSPANFLWGLDFYWQRVQADYQTGLWSTLLVAGFLLVGFFSWRKFKPGVTAIVFFVILAALLTMAHPNRKSRYLHSWIPAAWVLAGIGASTLAHRLLSRRRKTYIATGLVAMLAIWQLHDPFLPGQSPEVGHRRLDRSTLDITDFYLPYLEQSRHAAFFATVPVKHFAKWTFLERYKDRSRLEVYLKRFGPSHQENKRRFQKWLQTTQADTIVFLDVPPGSRFYFPVQKHYSQYRELLSSQSVFKPFVQRYFPEYGCTVSLWRRSSGKGMA